MMRITRRIKAFTILEVTVAMLLASVSIAIAYTAFDILSRSYRGFDSRNKALAGFVLSDKLMRRDFADAQVIKRTDNGLDLQMDSGIIHYEFNTAYILRNQYSLRTDTIHLATADHLFTFEQQQAGYGSMVDRLQLTVVIDDQAVNRIYTKSYSAADLFNSGHISK